MKILITGGTGYIGTTLVPYIMERGFNDVCLLVRNQSKAYEIYGTSVQYISTENEDWRGQLITYSPDVVLHLAGLLNSKHDADSVEPLVRSNVLFTTQLLEAVSHTECKYFVNVGSCWEYRDGGTNPNPNTLYAATKLAVHPIMTFYQSLSKWKWVNVVVYSAYGKRNTPKKIFELIYDALDAPTPHPFTEGNQILDFIHVEDIADFFYTLLTKLDVIKESYTQFHLGTGEGHSLRKVASILEDITGKKVNAVWGALPYRPHEVMKSIAPIAENIRLLGWKSTKSIRDGWGGVIRSISNNYE
jgi:CDP-paratose synthetase